MSLYVTDASVAVKWFLAEKHSEEARRLLDNSNQLFTPSFFFLEMDNVFIKHVHRKELTPTIAERMRLILQQHPFQVHSDRTLRDTAYEISIKAGCSLYDALYLALAVNLGERMVTADKRLYNNLSTGPFAKNVLWIEDLPDRNE